MAELGPLEIGAILTGAKLVASDMYTKAKGLIGRKEQEWTTTTVQRGLTSRVQEFSEVKTVLFLESPVLLTEFYAEQHLELPDGTKVKIRSCIDLDHFPRLLISGVAGQGKSMLFRFLALRELQLRRVPLFVELRHYVSFGNLNKFLANEVGNLGFDEDDETLAAVMRLPEVTVFLDAFDEIPPSHQMRARKEIDDLCRRYPTARILVSTRPSLTLESSPFFRVAKISQLDVEDAVHALGCMCDENDDINSMIDSIRSPSNNLEELLVTPLMVALLLLHHRLTGEFPETEQAFYGDLFDVLLRRHDQTKGYKRERYSNASEIELGELFGYLAFCFRKEGALEVSRDSLVKRADNAREFHDRQFDAAGAIDDIIHGTNLILEEGAVCRFAHKSVQEFYAARFLLAQSEHQIELFLSNRVKAWGDWEQMLQFTATLNRCMFIKYFLRRHVGWIAFQDEHQEIDRGWIPANRVFDAVFGDDTIYIHDAKVLFFGWSHNSVFFPFRNRKVLDDSIFHFLNKVDWARVPPDPGFGNGHNLSHLKDVGEDLRPFTFSHLLKQPFGSELRRVLKKSFDDVIPRILQAYEFMARRESSDDLFG